MTKAAVSKPNAETDWTARALNDACAAVGLDPTGARLIKFTNNAVWALASAPVVVRIPGSAAVQKRVPKIIAVARWLACHDMPSVRLIEELPQPLQLDQSDITFWHHVPVERAGTAPDGRDLGRILQRYHALPAPSFDLPQWRPLLAIRQRIVEQDMLAPGDQRFLEDKCNETEELLTRIDFQLPWGPIHGDGFVGNLIAGPDGSVICDFDSAAYGPREWDLTPIAVGQIRFRYATNYQQQIIEEYGVDITQWQHFSVLRQLRELQLVTSVLPVLRTNPSLSEQWATRFMSFRNADTTTIWTPYR
ncbi:aminoglycoside phosphotransferase family protein [Nocardia sp. NPDC004654]|uniref:aminoglycoside phosphotransferase family protein n=1 Tax=Nocardia sp. NPDC004654 TaxID=3154776 RepID=UPI0033B29B77